MKTINEVRLTEILPANLLQDSKIAALAAAIDSELDNLSALIPKTLFLPHLDSLSGYVLDLLGHQFHIENWEPVNLDDQTKRNLIRNSIAWHRRKGTRAAVEEADAAFGRTTKIQEWFEYAGGQPYHFRAITAPFKDDDEMTAWLRRINDAKNVRSWFDIVLENDMECTAYAGIATFISGRMRIGLRGSVETTELNTIIHDDDRTLLISDSQIIVRYGQDERVIPLADINGDGLRIRFAFPSSDRILTLNNIRADLTAQDVQKVTDYAVKNKIFINDAGETTSSTKRVTLTTTTVQILF